jgi:glycosyltransferase involved in cell wall biosynthesis
MAGGLSARVLIVSLGTTSGWLVNEAELCGSLRRLGVEHDVVRVRLGLQRHLRRTGIWTVVDAIEAAAARRALRRGLAAGRPSAVIVLSTTAALLLPLRRLRSEGIPVAIRVDCPSSISRPGPQNAIQRALERRRLREATLALATGQRSAVLLAPLARRVEVVPVPVEVGLGDAAESGPPRDVLTYAADPDNKGLDLVCRAWWALGSRTEGRLLHVTGVSPERGRRVLLRKGLAEPPGLRWHGPLPREEHLRLLRGAAAYVSASAWEGAGIAQLEALALGVPLVTTPSRGAYEAYGIAQGLEPSLLAARRDAGELTRALGAALELAPQSRRRYASAAAEGVRPFSRAAADRALAEQVLPLLLEGASGT